MIYFTSDTHFMHDKEFLWGGRGFNSSAAMCEEIVKRWNETITPEDEVYHLGDLVLSDVDAGIEYVKQLNGKIHLIRGNHDTDAKIEKYKACSNIVSIDWSLMIRYKKIHIYLSHYPSVTRTPEDQPNKQGILNFYGHTHQITNFYYDNFYMYHVGMDSHDLKPVAIDTIIEEIRQKKQNYYNSIENL